MSTRKRGWKPPRCPTGKIAYRSQGPALAAIEAIRRGNMQAAAPLPCPQGAYRCSCGAWHLSRQAGTVR